MSQKILLKKTCSIYASDVHLATMIFPYLKKEIEDKAIIKTLLENTIDNHIEKIICCTHLDPLLKQQMQNIRWEKTNIEEIEQILKDIEKNLETNGKIDIIVSGSNLFIDKINQLIDLWADINFEQIANNQKVINVINCYHFKENEQIENIMKKYEYILKTSGIQEIIDENCFRKAN